jgi:lipopolysaccharide exporter
MIKSSNKTPTVSGPNAAPAEEPLAYRAVRGGLWVVIGSYWSIGFGFVANVVLTRLLSPEIIGLAGLGGFFAQLLRVSPRLGLGYAFVRHKENSSDALGTYFATECIAILAGVALTMLAAPVLLYLGYTSPVVLLSIVFALSNATESIMGVGATLLEKELLFGRTSLIMSATATVSYLPAFWIAARGGGVWSLVAQSLSYNLLLVIAIWWTVRRRMPQIWHVRWRFSPTLARHFLSFGITIGLGNLAGMLVTNLDNFLVGTFVGVTALGFYDRAYRTAQWPSTLLSGLIARAAFNTYAKLQDDLVRLQKTVTMILWIISTLALPLALVIFITAPDLIVFLYQERWLPSAPFLRVLVLIAAVRPIWENAGALMVALGEPRLTALLCWVQVLVLVIAGLPMTIAWGATGTCLAVGLAFAVGVISLYRVAARRVPVKLETTLVIPALISVLVLLGYVLLNRLTPLNDLSLPFRLGVKSLYAPIAFFLLTLLVQPRATRERVAYVWRFIAPTLVSRHG